MIAGLTPADLTFALLLGAAVAIGAFVARRGGDRRLARAIGFGVAWSAANLAFKAIDRSLGSPLHDILTPIAGVAVVALVVIVFWNETRPMRQEPGPPR